MEPRYRTTGPNISSGTPPRPPRPRARFVGDRDGNGRNTTEVQPRSSSRYVDDTHKNKNTKSASGAAGAGHSAGQSSNVTSIFECPVCFEFVLPPIIQCERGHLVCGNCRPQMNSICPTCRGPLDNIRNLALEKIAEITNFPCKYNQSGCQESLTPKAKISHEETCKHKHYICPCPGADCTWVGAKEQVLQHLHNVHPSITTLQGDDIVFLATNLNLETSADWVMMQSCFGHQFMLVLQKNYVQPFPQYYFQVMLMDTKQEAERFSYKVDLHHNHRRLSFQSIPKSLDDLNNHSPHAYKIDCLHFTADLTKFFVDRRHNLNINVLISLEGDADSNRSRSRENSQ